MSEVNKAEVQKMFDAQKGDTQEAAAKQNPLVALNPETGNFFFKNEYERKMFLVGLESAKVDAAIAAVNGDKVGLSSKEKEEYLEELKKLREGLEDTKHATRASLRKEMFVIDATIPGPKWKKSDEVTVEGKKYAVEKREWSEKGTSDLKIDAGLTASVVVRDVPDDKIDAVLKMYESAQKDAKDSLLKSGWFGKTVKYGEIKSLIEKVESVKPTSAISPSAPETPSSQISVAPTAAVPIKPAKPAESPVQTEKTKIKAVVKEITWLADGYALSIEDKSPNKQYENGGAVVLKKGDKIIRYMSIDDSSNNDKLKDADSLKKWAEERIQKYESWNVWRTNQPYVFNKATDINREARGKVISQ